MLDKALDPLDQSADILIDRIVASVVQAVPRYASVPGAELRINIALLFEALLNTRGRGASGR